MAPALPEVDAPVPIAMYPLFPLLEVPELKDNSPLGACFPEFGDLIVIDPLVALREYPLKSCTKPPVPGTESPAEEMESPPLPPTGSLFEESAWPEKISMISALWSYIQLLRSFIVV
jgi:hypothetical protein